MRIHTCLSLATFLTTDNSVQGVSAAVTIDNYSLLIPTATDSQHVVTPVITGAVASVAGVSSLGVQANGETKYAETVVVTQDVVVSGTSTLTSFSRAPSTTVCEFAVARLTIVNYLLIYSM